MENTPITLETIEAAERLVGVNYTREERELMLDGLDGQIEEARARRALTLENHVPPASRFDPRLPGFRPPPPQAPVRACVTDPGPLPDSDEDIAFAPVTSLSWWIARGDLTSRRLTEIYLDRIEAHAARLECFVTVTPELARAQADAADALLRAGTRLGPLHGIPYGLKDLFDTSGILTTWGAAPYRDRVPDGDARVVELLRSAGAVLLGKTTLGALAYGEVWFGGKTRNPWNLDEGSSGSSAGSASATAAGLCAFSIGTETLGSITAPSQRCGTTGLRPTFGRVSRAGGMALCWSLDKVGPICRSVEDCALVLAAINGPDPADRSSIGAPFNFDATRDVAGLRIGYLPATFEDDGATDVDRAALEATRRLGVEVVEVALPDLPYGSLMSMLFAEAAAAFEELTLTDRDDELVRQDKGAWPNAFRQARFLSAVDHVQLDRLRYRVMQALDATFREVDAMIGPFGTGPMLVASNFTGHPCLHLRAGFLESPTRGDPSLEGGKLDIGSAAESAESHEVPQGISLWGPLFDEGRLLNLGMALEAELGVAARRPDLQPDD
ncbi:MAG: amidase [Immundisolibacterales bacterium]|nr:amidase [Immundisolibacterales bacterium]